VVGLPIMEVMNVKDDMSVPEVALYLGVSRQSVWRWIRSGRLPARKVGKSYIVRKVHAQGMEVYRLEMARLQRGLFARKGKRGEADEARG